MVLSPFFCKLVGMKKKNELRKDVIGSKVYHAVLNKHFTIEYGSEDLYERLGLDVFKAPGKPKLKKDAKNRKRSNDTTIRNSNGTDYDS